MGIYRGAGPRRLHFGGGSGIRTHDTLAGITVFKTVAFVHSAIPPRGFNINVLFGRGASLPPYCGVFAALRAGARTPTGPKEGRLLGPNLLDSVLRRKDGLAGPGAPRW